MGRQEIFEIAEQYLRKHTVHPDQFGLGPWLDKKDSNFDLTVDYRSRDLIFSPFDTDFFDCYSMANAVYKDIRASNPELQPKIKVSKNSGIHYWVEVTAPETGEAIQIDTTPWYSSIHTKHIGEEIHPEQAARHTPISENRGPVLSVKKLGDETVSVYLSGYSPKFSLSNRLAAINNGQEENNAHYIFYLQAKLENGFGCSERTLTCRVSVKDIRALNEELQHELTLEEIERKQIIEITYLLGGIHSFAGFDRESAQRVFASDAHEPLFEEINRNLPRLGAILKKCQFTMPMVNGIGDRIGVDGFIVPKSRFEFRPERHAECRFMNGPPLKTQAIPSQLKLRNI